MIIKTEVPDMELHPKEYPNDVMKIFIRKNEIEIRVAVDGAGNEWIIDKKEFMEKIKW